ncbi:MAG: hypothetical protein V4443_06370 [Pseudomonadota bacterium]
MLKFLISLVVLVVPVMLAAKFVDAGRQSFFAALVAATLALICGYMGAAIVGGSIIGLFVATVVVVMVFKVVLDTSIPSALGLTIIAVALYLAIDGAVGSFQHHLASQ